MSGRRPHIAHLDTAEAATPERTRTHGRVRSAEFPVSRGGVGAPF